ncbi:MAG: hypothetical protein LBV34_11855 [Nocardiopsaceae bacterium]|jgi:hypothetical protein|nr:hypothetical protein [Nocardiopsaceae bacterium]
MSDIFAANIGSEQAHGRSLAAEFDELSAGFHRATTVIDLQRSDFGGTAEAGHAAEAYFGTLSALATAMDGLRDVGLFHARKIGQVASVHEEVQVESSAAAQLDS